MGRSKASWPVRRASNFTTLPISLARMVIFAKESKPMHTDERIVTAVPAEGKIVGLPNFREFGGLPVKSGRRMRKDWLFRSEHIHSLSEAGIGALCKLGIRTVVDLRGALERTAMLGSFGDRLSIAATPIEPRVAERLRRLLESDTVRRSQVRQLMLDSYRGYVTHAAEEFGNALAATVIAAQEAPVLVHCTAGKDRTGFTVAIIQAALGVPWKVILSDYMATNDFSDRSKVAGHLRIDGEIAEPVLVADEDYLVAAFEEVHRVYKDPVAFVTTSSKGRVTPELLAGLLE